MVCIYYGMYILWYDKFVEHSPNDGSRAKNKHHLQQNPWRKQQFRQGPPELVESTGFGHDLVPP